MTWSRAATVGLAGTLAAVAVRQLLAADADPLNDLYATDGPLVFGHRGASRLAPENTLAAFQAALNEGADGVELDVQLTRDGQLVVLHDWTLDRTTNGSGALAASTLEEVRRLDAGAWFGPSFGGQRVPTLHEALQLAGDRLIVNVEIKTMQTGRGLLERRVVEQIQALGMERRVIVSSFSALSIWRVRRLSRRIPVGLLFVHGGALPNRLVRPNAIHPQWQHVSASLVDRAKRAGQRVNVWTVDDPSAARALANLRVDALISNVPGTVRHALSPADADALAAPSKLSSGGA